MHRLGDSDGKHTAQQKFQVLRHKQALSQLPSSENPQGFVVNPSALTRTKCPSTSVREKGSPYDHVER